ncbi:hypothetical protein [Trichothermofontia sp.]
MEENNDATLEELRQLLANETGVTVSTSTIDRMLKKRISTLDSLPDRLDRKTVKDTLKKLNVWKSIKPVQKLLRDYTDGAKARLETPVFVTEPIKDTDEKNLILDDGIKPTALMVSLLAMPIRA